VAKTFAERGIPFDCFEALADVGGIWNPQSPHVVYGSTYLNSSKKLSKYPDYDFPEEWPHYLSRAQAQDYLHAYAKAFGLYDRIIFNARQSRGSMTGSSSPTAIIGTRTGRATQAPSPERSSTPTT
jgi:cation diffusion facilitator CzcD-associated flavoprotein CzcO